MKMTDEQKQERKNTHNRNMILLAARALEHGLRRLLPENDETRKIIEEDLAIVRKNEWDLDRRHLQSRGRRPKYTVAGELMRGSTLLLELAVTGGPFGRMTDSALHRVEVSTSEASSLASIADGEMSGDGFRVEADWQAENIYPLVVKAFENYGLPLTELQELPAIPQEQAC